MPSGVFACSTFARPRSRRNARRTGCTRRCRSACMASDLPRVAAAARAGDLTYRGARRATRTQRASLTAVASLLDYGAKVVVGLVVVPILVSGLGRSLYGVWEMLNRLVGYMTGADGRPTEALRLVVASHQGD